MTTADHPEFLMASVERNERSRLQNSQLIYDESTMRGMKTQSHRFDSQQLKASVSGAPSIPSVVGSRTTYPPMTSTPTVIDPNQVRSALAMLAASSPLSSPDTPSALSLSPPSSIADGLVAPLPVAQLGSSTTRSRRSLDRSASEPLSSSTVAAAVLLEQSGIAAAGGLGPPGSAAFCRYKTELCRPFEENGTCKYADKCQFAHGRAELRPIIRHPKYKTDLCRTYHTTGLCPYGPRCHFIHNDEERRLNEVNRMVIEQQQQQRAVLLQAAAAAAAAAQQQELMATSLLAQRRLEAAAGVQTSSLSAPHQVDQAIVSSLQRSLSLGSSRPSVGSSSAPRTGGGGGSVGIRTAAATVGSGAVSHSSGCGRGSVDSVVSMGSSPSPTSSATSNITSSSSSSSDVESPPSTFQRLSGDRRQRLDHRQVRDTSPSSSPEHFSFPVIVADNPGSFSTTSSRQSSSSIVRHQQQQLQPSADAAIMLSLLARRMRDAELQQQQAGREEEAKATMLLAKLLQSATASTTQIDVAVAAAALESAGFGGRCGGRRVTAADQRWAMLHGTAACGDMMRL